MADPDAGRSPAARLLEEIHGRSMWQILGIYLGGSWGLLQVLDPLVQHYILPGWVFPAAMAILAVGLPIVIATAYFEGGRRRGRRKPRPSAAREAPTPAGEERRQDTRRLLTWRNATLGGVGAFAVLGVISTAFFISRSLGVGPGAPLVAQGVLEEREPLVLAELENRTADSLLARAVTEALRVDLAQSPAVRLVEPDRVREILDLMNRDPGDPLDEDLAREVAERGGIKAVLTGAVDQLGSRYAVSARLVSAQTGEQLLGFRETAGNLDDVLDAVSGVSRRLRAGIGESLASVNASPALPQVTTASLDALKRYATGILYHWRGERTAAIRLLHEAVEIDSTFAAAARALSIFYGNQGNVNRRIEFGDLAYRFADRLPDNERYLVLAAHHSARGRLDSAAIYYERLIDLDPEHGVAHNNLGDLYEWLGRYEDALTLYVRASELDPGRSTPLLNIASAARTLGRFATADSAIGLMERQNPNDENIGPQRSANAIYAGRFDELETMLANLATMSDPFVPIARNVWGGYLDASSGHPARAMERADTAATLLDAAGQGVWAFSLRHAILGAALAAERPEAMIPYLERWDPAETMGGSDRFLHLALGWLGGAQARAGRLAQARRTLARADSLLEPGEFEPYGMADHARAVIALAENDPEAAMEWVERARATDFGLLHHEYRFTLAEAHRLRGENAEAAAHYDSLSRTNRLHWTDVPLYPSMRPLAHERAGRAYLAIGDTAKAMEHLAAFVELWSEADPELRPRVEAARRTIEEIFRQRG